jgi:hypothetical protein
MDCIFVFSGVAAGVNSTLGPKGERAGFTG